MLCQHLVRTWILGFFKILLGLEFECGVSCLQSRHSATWATPLFLFALVIFGDGVLKKFCLGWPQTMIFQISASQCYYQVTLVAGLDSFFSFLFFFNAIKIPSLVISLMNLKWILCKCICKYTYMINNQRRSTWRLAFPLRFFIHSLTISYLMCLVMCLLLGTSRYKK
jgi:hypothetical protein